MNDPGVVSCGEYAIRALALFERLLSILPPIAPTLQHPVALTAGQQAPAPP